MALKDAYTKEILKQRGTYATYPFGDQVKVGDFGTLDGNVFNAEGKLENQSWYEGNLATTQGARAESISLTSAGEVNVTFKAEGKKTSAGTGVIPLDSAGFIIEFGKKHSVILECQGVRNHALSHLTHIAGQIIDRFKADKWPKDRVLVTEVWRAESSYVAVSRSSNVKVELEVSGSVSGGGTNELANIDAGLTYRASKSDVDTAIIDDAWTPYFVLYKIKKPALGAITFERI